MSTEILEPPTATENGAADRQADVGSDDREESLAAFVDTVVAGGELLASPDSEADAAPIARQFHEPIDKRLHHVVLSTLFAAVLGLQIWTSVEWRLTTHAPGTELYWSRSGQIFGSVIGYQPGYRFPTGVRSDAYLIRPTDGQPRWLPKQDVNRSTERLYAPIGIAVATE